MEARGSGLKHSSENAIVQRNTFDKSWFVGDKSAQTPMAVLISLTQMVTLLGAILCVVNEIYRIGNVMHGAATV